MTFSSLLQGVTEWIGCNCEFDFNADPALLFVTLSLALLMELKYGRVLNAVGSSMTNNAFTASCESSSPSPFSPSPVSFVDDLLPLASFVYSSVYGIEPGNSPPDYLDFPPTEEPVWILGRQYSTLHELEDLRADFRSRAWITYRTGFTPIGGTGPTSDRGWGCMLRCGQMVLAQALIVKHLGREWRWKPLTNLQQRDLQEQDEAYSLHCLYIKVLSQFQDKKNCPYSIHQIAQMGASEGKPVGQWFGPNTIAQALRKLAAYDHFNDIVIHVALDNAVIISDIKSQCKPKVTQSKDTEDKNRWKPLILFIPLRLGLTEINPIYFKALKSTFRFQQSLGIIGGRPNHAAYFVGYVGNDLVYLDPHTTQSVVDLENGSLPGAEVDELETEAKDSSYHCEYAMRMDVKELDPSVSLCFYHHSESDFDSWCHLVTKSLVMGEKQPLFELVKERPPHWPPLHVPDDPMNASVEGFAHYDVDMLSASRPPPPSSPSSHEVAREAFTVLDPDRNAPNDSDDGFELLG